jgi:hypothetical protein
VQARQPLATFANVSERLVDLAVEQRMDHGFIPCGGLAGSDFRCKKSPRRNGRIGKSFCGFPLPLNFRKRSLPVIDIFRAFPQLPKSRAPDV